MKDHAPLRRLKTEFVALMERDRRQRTRGTARPIADRRRGRELRRRSRR